MKELINIYFGAINAVLMRFEEKKPILISEWGCPNLHALKNINQYS